MQVQTVQFQREKDSRWEDGVARVKAFGLSDVEWIVDWDGQKVDVNQLWTYRLINGPLCCIDTEYR